MLHSQGKNELKSVYYIVIVHNFDLQEKTTSTVDKDNKSVHQQNESSPKLLFS